MRAHSFSLPFFLRLSQDKRRGWVARNTTHSSMHSCPVSSFSARSLYTLSSSVPFTLCSLCVSLLLPLISPFVRCSIHRVCNTVLPSSFESRSAYLSSSSVPSFLRPSTPFLPDSSSPYSSSFAFPSPGFPSSTPGVFCLIILSAHAASRYISPSTRHTPSYSLAFYLVLSLFLSLPSMPRHDPRI